MSKSKKYGPSNYTSGEYAVGTSCFSIIDEGRKELLGDAMGDRKIAVRMYYPVNKEDTVSLKRAAIFSERKANALCKAYHIPNTNDVMDCADYFENVSVSDDKRFPLIVFSQGYNSYIESNTYLLCDLASHGYIVASVGHAYEAVENDYEDGSFDLYDKKISKMMYTSVFKAIKTQKKLLKANIDKEEALVRFDEFQNTFVPYIKGRVPEWKADAERALQEVKVRYATNIDFTKGIGATGHSLGGCLAYYLCKYNEEFTCGINIDGALFGEYPKKTMDRPFMQISCKENINFETRPLIDTCADVYHVIFEDMKHIGFTDAKFFVPVKMVSGKLDNEEMYKHLAYSHISFFDKYLKGEPVEITGIPSDKISYIKY